MGDMEIKKILGSRVLLERIDKGEIEIGGIIIPEGEGEHLVDGYWYKCHMIGRDCEEIIEGDIVFLPRFSGHRVKYKGRDYCLVTKERDVMLVRER